MIDIILNEASWPVLALLLSLLAVVRVARPVTATMSLYYGSFIAIMGGGHLVAVSLKLALGTLRGSIPLLVALGLALAVPAAWLAVEAARAARAGRLVALNLALGVVLAASGPFNLPLVVPAALNVAVLRTTRPRARVVLAGVALVLYLLLFVAAVTFLTSGGTFEELVGLPVQ